ncbi:MAG TPA: sigma-70 family RNA polymerase sigma factor [Polyangiaceae bacterium]
MASLGAMAQSREWKSAPTDAVSADRDSRLRKMVDQHFDFIWRSLRGLGVAPGEVDDETQRVFWIAAQKLEQIAVGSERAFLFATARGLAANARRSRARSREVSDEVALATEHDDAPDPEQAASRNQARALLDRFLEDLPEDLRTVFVLFELEGLTSTEIASTMAIPIGTVASKLRRAREEFAITLKRHHARKGTK